ncbi:MAG TPA: radical SAM protein, partial [Ktedonobacter sp.]|nr:radical SAM protein [Ktedonobacter sp.]
MLEVLPQIAKMQASYALGKPLANPLNLTISVSYRCNSRCKTCNVWQRPNDDFTLEEYEKTFESIGRDAFWFTFSGGEPTLRKDLPEMVGAAYRHCRPGIINIPTNGIQDKIIPGRIERVLQAAPTSEVIINLSLDGVGEKHDIVRGVKGNFDRAMRTYAGLKALKGKYKNFTLGVHTVISNFNIDEFENIHSFVYNEL